MERKIAEALVEKERLEAEEEERKQAEFEALAEKQRLKDETAEKARQEAADLAEKARLEAEEAARVVQHPPIAVAPLSPQMPMNQNITVEVKIDHERIFREVMESLKAAAIPERPKVEVKPEPCYCNN